MEIYILIGIIMAMFGYLLSEKHETHMLDSKSANPVLWLCGIFLLAFGGGIAISAIIFPYIDSYYEDKIDSSLESIKYELNPIMYNNSISETEKFTKIQIECNKNKDIGTQYCIELLTQYYSNELSGNK